MAVMGPGFFIFFEAGIIPPSLGAGGGGGDQELSYPPSRGIRYIIKGKRLKKIYNEILESKNLKVVEAAKWIFDSVNWEIVAADQTMIDRLMSLYDRRNEVDSVIDPIDEPKKKGIPMAILMMMME